MKIWFSETSWPWPPERFHFSAEQMLLTLFPEEKPEYPSGPPSRPAAEKNAVLFCLRRGETFSEVNAHVFRPEKSMLAGSRASSP